MAISTERTLILPEYNGMTPGLSFPLVWPAKDPGDVDMDFSLDVSGWLLEIQDTIKAFTVGWTPEGGTGDLTIASASSHNAICTIFASGGVAWTTYAVTFAITGQLTGEVLSRTIRLPVEPRYAGPVSVGSVSGTVT